MPGKTTGALEAVSHRKNDLLVVFVGFNMFNWAQKKPYDKRSNAAWQSMTKSTGSTGSQDDHWSKPDLYTI